MCFSTNEVALKSFWQFLHRNLPSSSCLMYCSQARESSLFYVSTQSQTWMCWERTPHSSCRRNLEDRRRYGQ